MISGDSYENGQKKKPKQKHTGKKNWPKQQNKYNFARTRAAQFLCNIFAVVLHDYNVKLLKTSQLHFLWGKCRICF